MSGPKIIDIEASRHVERGRIAVLSARLEKVLERHMRFCEQSGQSSPVNADVLREFREAAANPEATVFKLIEIRDQIASQIDFVKNETSRLKDIAIESVSRSRTRAAALDKAIMRVLDRSRDEELRQQLFTAKNTQSVSEKAKLYETALSSMEKKVEADDHESIHAWLEELEADSKIEEVGSELPLQHPQRWRLEVERIRTESAFLASSAPGQVAEIRVSLARIESESNLEKRAILLDDLRYPLAEQLRQAREYARRQEQVELWLVALSVHADYLDLDEWKKRFENEEKISALEVETAIEKAIAAAAATAARREIMVALQSMGYELRSGMETAFVRDGRMVVKRPNDLDYGVELSTFPEGDVNLIRTRVVRTRGVEAQTDDERLRDKEREELWCGDQEKMADLLELSGIKSEIKTARAAGEVTIPVIGEREEGSKRREVAGKRGNTSRQAR